MHLRNLLLIISAAAVGLSAGLLFAYSVSVNPGLGRLGDEAYLLAMQSINSAIQNGLFFAVYFSPLLLLPLSCHQVYSGSATMPFVLMLAATALYVLGVAGITIVGNVPLNNALEAFQIKTATTDALRQQRRLFEAPWNRLHAFRTVAAVLSFALLLVAMLKYSARPMSLP